MMYPFYINAVNDFIDQKRMEEVQEQNIKQNKEQVRKAKERMKKRNEELKKNGLVPKAPKFTNDNERKIVSDEYIRKHLICPQRLARKEAVYRFGRCENR